MTHEHLDNQMFNEAPEGGVFSMTDQALYGEVKSNHPYPEMVRRGLVAATNIHLLQTDAAVWDQIESAAEVHLRNDDTGEEFILTSDGQKALAGGMIAGRKWLAEAIENGYAKKVLPFFSRISDCERAIDSSNPLSLVYGDQHDIHREVFHSGLTSTQRMRAKNTFSGHSGPAIMPSVGAIREGVSIDDVDTIMLFRGYGSDDSGVSVLLIQHHGRGVRLAQGKTACNLVIPIPPTGRAEVIRRNVLRMARSIMEELGMLSELVRILEQGDEIDKGTLQNNNIHVHPSTPVSIAEIVDAVNFTVLEYIKETNSPLYTRLEESKFDDMYDDVLST